MTRGKAELYRAERNKVRKVERKESEKTDNSQPTTNNKFFIINYIFLQ